MSIIKPLVGKRVILRCAEEKDAAFTLAIRNDPKLTEYIPKVDVSLEEQKKWIASQQKRLDSCFMVYENLNGICKGTLSFYDIDTENKICELGRYISCGNALENVEAVILLLDYIYDNGFEQIILNNDIRNKKIINFWRKFGAELFDTVDMGSWTAAQYRLHKSDYELQRSAVASLLKRG